jgi:hypothetical protein
MQRTISYSGDAILDESLVVGNHSNVHIQVNGNFKLKGLIYCPKQSLKLTIKGSGTITLHGVCKRVEIKSTGNCILDLINLKITELRCRSLNGSTVLKVGDVKNVIEKNIGEQALVITVGTRTLAALNPSSYSNASSFANSKRMLNPLYALLTSQ